MRTLISPRSGILGRCKVEVNPYSIRTPDIFWYTDACQTLSTKPMSCTVSLPEHQCPMFNNNVKKQECIIRGLELYLSAKNVGQRALPFCLAHIIGAVSSHNAAWFDMSTCIHCLQSDLSPCKYCAPS